MICRRCVLDDRIPGITYNEKGICNYCQTYDELNNKYTHDEWLKIVEKIKWKQRKHPKYDVIVGVSGGCDSSYLLHLCKKENLRPLAVHFNNGWDTKEAEANLQQMSKLLDVDIVTYNVNQTFMNDINYAFLVSGVPDCDIPNDIALTAVLYKAAEDFKIPFIFDGHCYATEGTCPVEWSYMDGKYIIDVHRQHGRLPEAIEFFPNLTLRNWLYWIIFKRIKRYRPLYYFHYDKRWVKKFLKYKYGFKWYGGHHLENIYTAFCGKIMFPMFNMDRTIIELAALVRSGQMKRESALMQLSEEDATDYSKITKEVEKRLNVNIKDVIRIPERNRKEYYSYRNTFRRWRWFFWILMKAKLIPETFYIKYCKAKK